ncbi:MAG: hypothetical protein ACC655_05980 [Rhodothermia bacterium]
MVEYTRAHERIAEEHLPGTRFELADVVSKPILLYLPDHATEAKAVQLVVHFHGSAYVPERAAYDADHPTAVVVVNLGAGSRVYERAFDGTPAFGKLVQAARDSLSTVGVDQSGDIVLTAFSAGYGAVRAILREARSDIGGIVLLDGLHTDYVPDRLPLFDGGRLETTRLDPFVAFARQAVAGSKRMLITHSEIFPGTFASTTETTDYLIGELGLARRPVLIWGPVGMQQLSEVRSGDLLILGFAGNSAPDHVDHFHGMPAFLNFLE